MKIQIIILFLTFISIFSIESYSLLGIELEVDGKIFNLYLWDTIGQEKLKSLTKIFFKNSKIVVLVYDITNKQSFQGLNYWLKEVREVLGENIIIGICGNKADLYLNEEVSEDDCKEYANKLKSRWICTSAKTNEEAEYLLSAFNVPYKK